MNEMKVCGDMKVPIKCWFNLNDVESGALDQARNAASLPSAFHHVALMPDCHSGYSVPIGSVIALQNMIVPFAIGVDIGCGMIAVKTNFHAEMITKEDIEKIMHSIKRIIPVGFDHQKERQSWVGFEDNSNGALDIPVIKRELDSARKQLGTLGGGNHFIELQKGNDGLVWLMIHSGSRNLGKQIAEMYHKMAMDIEPEGRRDLVGFKFDSFIGQEYYRAMDFALRFSYANRALMMERFKREVNYYLHCQFEQEINIHHNYANPEKHFGEDVILHRKGATSALKGQLGIIPGSMGTPSYIVKGLGNPESFMSCSHGAGRKMGRGEANRTLNEEDCLKAMEGIVFEGFGTNRKGKKELDEAPAAYKDIEQVIQSQDDLVEIVTKLLPLGVVKG